MVEFTIPKWLSEHLENVWQNGWVHSSKMTEFIVVKMADNIVKWLSNNRKWLLHGVMVRAGSIDARRLGRARVGFSWHAHLAWLVGQLLHPGGRLMGPSHRVLNSAIHHLGWWSPTKKRLTNMSPIHEFGQPFQTRIYIVSQEWTTKIMNDWHFGQSFLSGWSSP
jgi:hypothetical protein